MVVSQKNYNDAQGIFSWLKTLGTKALSIYPSFHKHKGMLSDLTITNSQYATFLIEMFDLWIKNKRPFRINLYNDVLAGLNFQKYRLCYLSGNCSSMNIDNSGNIFDSCVHQTQETWLGHVTSSDFRELFNEHLRRSTKGLNNTDIVEIMRQDTYSYRFSKDKVCYQFGQNGSFYFMRAIWQLNKHINLLLKGIRNDEEGTAKNIRKS